ncbi:MAG TPA: VOC family protein [Polyangiaceae bacterium]|jgi:lactoylglutathione lyase|nr:VOC family protein [Polyangiaceae bacterium]
MSARPFRILGVQQIALGALDKQPLLEFWSELLGLPVRASFESASENVSEAILEIGVGVARVELDLMQPLDPASKPKVHEPALNHFGLWVDDLAAAYGWLSAHGVRFTPGGIRRGAAGHDVCFVHPKPSSEAPRSAEGVLVELVQAPPEVIAAFAVLAAAELR